MSNPESPHSPSAGASPETSERKVVRLEDENTWLRQQCARLEEQNARLVERIQTLEHRLGPHSRNSGEPPSSDGLKKPKAQPRAGSLRDKSERKPGGPPGHKGSTLRRTEHPDRVEDHVPAACEGCGASLSDAAAAGTPGARQVFDLPEPIQGNIEQKIQNLARARYLPAATPVTVVKVVDDNGTPQYRMALPEYGGKEGWINSIALLRDGVREVASTKVLDR